MLPQVEHLGSASESFHYQCFSLSHFPFLWHIHPEYELTLITAGSGQRFVGNHVDAFDVGEVVLLGKNLPHTWHSKRQKEQTSSSVVVQFREAFMGEDFFQKQEIKPMRQLLARSALGLRFHGQARQYAAQRLMAMDKMRPSTRFVQLMDMLDVLSRARNVTALSSCAFAVPLRQRDQNRTDRVLRFINRRYTQPLDQTDVASVLHMSASSFSRFFKRVTGRSFVAYVHELRVGRACRLLIGTDRAVTDICFDSGFNNVSNFNRIFQRLRGTSPRDFRNDQNHHETASKKVCEK